MNGFLLNDKLVPCPHCGKLSCAKARRGSKGKIEMYCTDTGRTVTLEMLRGEKVEAGVHPEQHKRERSQKVAAKPIPITWGVALKGLLIVGSLFLINMLSCYSIIQSNQP